MIKTSKGTKPKHQEILDSLLSDIGTGRYQPGDQLPTEFVLAEQFSVSRPTASRAVRELVNLGLVSRRAGQGTFVLPQDQNEQMVFGLIVPELGDSEIFEPICGYLARSLQRHGHVIQWAESDLSARHRQQVETATKACQGFIDRKVSGVFLAPFVTPQDMKNPNATIIETLRRSGIAVVLLDRDIVPFPHRSDFDLVGIDHLRGQAMMTEHLLSQGYQRLAFWVWPNAANTVRLRSAGIAQSLVEAGMSVDPGFLQPCDPDDADQVSALLKQQTPDAILCANDVFAGHLMKTLEHLGVRVPDDIAVAGYDDVRYADLLRVPLTTVSQPCEQIGSAAAQVMLERVQNAGLPPREVVVTPSLAIRKSTSLRSNS